MIGGENRMSARLNKGSRSVEKNDGLKRLKIPSDIHSFLPSVRNDTKYKKKKETPVENITDYVEEVENNGSGQRIVPPIKLGPGGKRRNENYILQVMSDRNFGSGVWDIVMSDNKIIVCTTKAAILCKPNLLPKKELDKVSLPGCATFLKDGRIAIACRQFDKVHLYEPDGTWCSEWSCDDFQPTGMTSLSNGNFVLTDPGRKQVRIYGIDGNKVKDIEAPPHHSFLWPLYVTAADDDSFYVTDCHAKLIHVFNSEGCWSHTLQPSAIQSSAISLPHCISSDSVGNMFIVDQSCGVIEVWRPSGIVLQSLLPTAQSEIIRPNIISIHKQTDRCAVGGKFGQVKLFRLERIDADKQMFIDITDS
ncbi:DgyrCDS4654 [Dimorphilus gyrociliatus]|uniref:DgyrCDS4654 n=1 Tax=Dimorphilus gyrociliatus TaxID=2664684 RepID=A0A7I8VH88_9ANNE|nr:DgyrCDS4654 [Dimorphilus gyrociliatus]